MAVNPITPIIKHGAPEVIEQIGKKVVPIFQEYLTPIVKRLYPGGEIVPKGAAELLNGTSKDHAFMWQKTFADDQAVKPGRTLLEAAGKEVEAKEHGAGLEAWDSFERGFMVEDSNLRLEQQTNEHLSKSIQKAKGEEVTPSPTIAENLMADLETKKAAWKQKYQTGEMGTVKPPTMEGLRAGDSPEVPLAGGSRDEMMADLQEYITLNEKIAKETKNKGLLAQPKKGWQSIFGNVIDDDGFPMRLDGGREASTGALKFTSTADNLNRKWNENIYIPSEDPKRKTFIKKWAKAEGVKVEKHHVIPIEQTSPWGYLNDGTPRSKADMDEIEAIVKRETGYDLGNKDWNEVYPTDRGHMGRAGDQTSLDFGAHRLLDNLTDFQGFKNWQQEATKIKFAMPPGSRSKVKWFNNNQGILSDTITGKELGNIDQMRNALRKKVDGKWVKPEATNFKVKGPGTYNITKGMAQKHGFSNELLATISRISDPELAAQTLVMFLKDSGAAETMEAAAALAFRVVDHGITGDEITRIWAKNHKQQMIDLAKMLLEGDDPLYKNNPILVGVVRAEQSAQALTKKLGI